MNDLSSTREEIPVYKWQIDELLRRKEILKENPASGLSWPDVKDWICNRDAQSG